MMTQIDLISRIDLLTRVHICATSLLLASFFLRQTAKTCPSGKCVGVVRKIASSRMTH